MKPIFSEECEFYCTTFPTYYFHFQSNNIVLTMFPLVKGYVTTYLHKRNAKLIPSFRASLFNDYRIILMKTNFFFFSNRNVGKNIGTSILYI